MEALLRTSATQLALMIARREISSVALVQAHLDQIAKVNPIINAVVQIAPDAMERARAADAAIAAGGPVPPLHGVPFTVKDWIETAGIVCAAGFAERRDFAPPRDATVVARFRTAGAILIGKTNVTQGAPVYARPNNYRNVAHTPGSSSSGEAAIIAAGGSPMGLASDSGGSIRWPAHCCGVAALKPSAGRVPNTGHFPRIGHLSDPRTTIGPMARSAQDLEIMLKVMAGEDAGDPGCIPTALGSVAAVDLAGLRVGWFAGSTFAAVTPATEQTIVDAAATLKDLGCTVSPIEAAWLEDSLTITRDYWARRRSYSLRDWRPAGAARLNEAAIERSIFTWERFSRRMSMLMLDFDLLLSPVAPRPAPLHEQWDETEFVFTLPYSLSGQPAAVAPFRLSPEGLPIGVQIAARRWRDDHALAAAAALERAA